MYIARKVTDLQKFYYWRSSGRDRFQELATTIEGFSSPIDCDEHSRTLKRRVHKLWKGQSVLVLIFRLVPLAPRSPRLMVLTSKRDMAVDKRWFKKF